MYGGSFANGKSLRQFCIFPQMQKLSWLLHSPVSSWINDETNKPHIMAEGWNESGGSTGEMFL
eukprot:1234617-Rhodomonas_salina.1